MPDPNEEIAQLKERIAQLETCYRITSLLNTELNLNNLLDSIMEIAKKVMKADACSLLLLDEKSNELVFQVALSEVSAEIKNMARLKVGQGIAGMVAETGKPLILDDAYSHPQFNPAFDKKTGFNTGALICAPLKAKDQIIGVCQVIYRREQGKTFDENDEELFGLFCDSAALAIQNARLHEVLMENQRFEKDMQFAQAVQESFLPATPPQHDNFLFAAQTRPALVVGGDYYDFMRFDDDSLGILLGDVSGKGVPAALQMARLMSDFRFISQSEPAPERVLAEINSILCARSYRGMFTTTMYLLLDLKHRKIQIANAGHHPALLCNSAKQVREIGVDSGTPLGVLPNVEYRCEEVALEPGDRILIYTDGVTEPKNTQDEQFGLERLQALLVSENGSPQAFIEKLEQAIQKHIGQAPQFDDLTCLAIQTR
ncbi:MAG: SpoIIE family protein phosphatase [Nitrospinae bacterium]|nr:SpoIIE family protein phosphatase [Nitrospinota bacterium]